MLKKILLTLLCILMGGVFIFSAWTKLDPIEPFEYTFVDLGIGKWYMAPFIARALIALEFFIGFSLLLNIRLKKITYKLGIATLLIFCIYLILQIVLVGNKGNCGCFGTMITMTPMQALIKNIIMLGAFFILYKYHEGWSSGKFPVILFWLNAVTAVAIPFIANPVELSYSESYLNVKQDNYKLDLDTMLYPHAELNVPPRTLSQGKHVIAFMSLTCPHCRVAAKKIVAMHKRNPEISFYFVLNGKDEHLKEFFDDTKCEEIPHCLLKKEYFVPLGGVVLPSIFLVNNSIVEHKVELVNLLDLEVEKWLEKK
jgi:hypothetical protein